MLFIHFENLHSLKKMALWPASPYRDGRATPYFCRCFGKKSVILRRFENVKRHHSMALIHAALKIWPLFVFMKKRIYNQVSIIGNSIFF
jgi:hypothetical protein